VLGEVLGVDGQELRIRGWFRDSVVEKNDRCFRTAPARESAKSTARSAEDAAHAAVPRRERSCLPVASRENADSTR
jgi:hypothetical protein